MFFRKMLRRLRDLFKGPVDMISEEEVLRQDLERLDREQPGWDHDAVVAGAQNALECGMDHGLVVEIYGEEIVREAEHLNSLERERREEKP